MNLKTLSLKAKLISMVAATVVVLCVISMLVLNSESSILLKDRQEKAQNLVETAYGIVAHFESLSRAGKMSPEEAKKTALETLRTLRYDKDQYFWVNDNVPVMIMHPFKPELEGQNLMQSKDPNGKLLFVEFVKTATSAAGGGFVDYFWPKPGSAEAVPKLSYVKGFEPWGWVIGTGIYIDDMDAIFRAQALKMLTWILLVGGLVVALAITLSHGIIQQLGGEPRDAAESMKNIAEGDLSVEIILKEDDNTSLMSSLRGMQMKLKTITSAIHDNSSALNVEIQTFTSTTNAYIQSKSDVDLVRLVQSIKILSRIAEALGSSVSRFKL
jgi:methyl-accepting chemotaxis protein